MSQMREIDAELLHTPERSGLHNYTYEDGGEKYTVELNVYRIGEHFVVSCEELEDIGFSCDDFEYFEDNHDYVTVESLSNGDDIDCWEYIDE